MAHVSSWQLGLHCVTAMLTPLPYTSIKFFSVNTKLNLILIHRHTHCIERLHCVTAMLTPLPYNSIKFFYANTKLNLILIYRHAHCIESFQYMQPTASMQQINLHL